MKKQKEKTANDFAAACERLSEAMIDVLWHPKCPEVVKEDLLGAVYDISSRVSD